MKVEEKRPVGYVFKKTLLLLKIHVWVSLTV